MASTEVSGGMDEWSGCGGSEKKPIAMEDGEEKLPTAVKDGARSCRFPWILFLLIFQFRVEAVNGDGNEGTVCMATCRTHATCRTQ